MSKVIRIGINGFGRIGRLVARAAIEQGGFEVVAINDLIDPKNYAKGVRFNAKLFEFDSAHGRFPGTVEYNDTQIIINGKPADFLSFRSLRRFHGPSTTSILSLKPLVFSAIAPRLKAI